MDAVSVAIATVDSSKSMARTASTMLPLGTQAPDFNLLDVVSNQMLMLENFSDKKGLLVMFICRHCPFVKNLQTGLATLAQDYANADLAIAAISANDAENYPDDAPESLKVLAQKQQFQFPILYDETQETAKAYMAACTPDFFLFDEMRSLVYRGQFDDSRPGNNLPVTGQDLRAAIDALLANQPVNPEQKPSIGCNIKWKPGNAPSYYS